MAGEPNMMGDNPHRKLQRLAKQCGRTSGSTHMPTGCHGEAVEVYMTTHMQIRIAKWIHCPKPGRYTWNCVISISQARKCANNTSDKLCCVLHQTGGFQCIYMFLYLGMFHSCQSSEIGGEPSSGLMLPPKHASKTCRHSATFLQNSHIGCWAHLAEEAAAPRVWPWKSLGFLVRSSSSSFEASQVSSSSTFKDARQHLGQNEMISTGGQNELTTESVSRDLKNRSHQTFQYLQKKLSR